MSLIIAIIVGHWVGDFLLQSDWMALNKSKNWLALFSHTIVYTIAMVVSMGVWLQFYYDAFILAPLSLNFDIWNALGSWGILNFLMHTWQDAVTSTIIASPWAAQNRHRFFVMIGLDQVLHHLFLFWSVRLMFF